VMKIGQCAYPCKCYHTQVINIITSLRSDIICMYVCMYVCIFSVCVFEVGEPMWL
jgi:hypothetical protein